MDTTMTNRSHTMTTATKPARTPGPWHVNAIKAGRIVGDEMAAEFDKLQISNHNCTVATAYRPQDARFIADAPQTIADLIAALRWAVGFIGAGELDEPQARKLVQARAALAAAEGKV